MKIKQATKDDIQTIESLYLKKIKQLDNKNIKQWDTEEVLWENLSKDYKIEEFYIVRIKEKVVGSFILVDFDPTYWIHDKPKQALYIHKLMVDECVKKQGVSDAILTFFKEEGKRRGYTVVKLDVRAHKEKLRSLYERNGFQLVEVVNLQKGYLTALYEYQL